MLLLFESTSSFLIIDDGDDDFVDDDDDDDVKKQEEVVLLTRLLGGVGEEARCPEASAGAFNIFIILARAWKGGKKTKGKRVYRTDISKVYVCGYSQSYPLDLLLLLAQLAQFTSGAKIFFLPLPVYWAVEVRIKRWKFATFL